MARLPSKLPTQDSLGPMPSARSGRAIARIDGSAIGKAQAELGANVVKIGAHLDARAQEEENLEVERRLLEFQSGQERALDESRRTLTGDPTGFAQNTRQGHYAGARDLLARSRQDGLSERSVAVLKRGLFAHEQRIHSRAYDAELDQRGLYHEDRTQADLERMTNDYLTAPDDAARERIRRNAEAAVDLARRSGMAPAGERRLRPRIEGMIEQDAQNRLWEDPYGTLAELTEGDRRARADSAGAISEQGLSWLRRSLPQERAEARNLSPLERQAADKKLRDETVGLSKFLNESASGLTQLQHDALVSYGFRRGQAELEKLLPDVQAGNWEAVAGAMTGRPSEAPAAGQIEPGNIDLNNRPRVRNANGSISTVRTITTGMNIDGRDVHVAIPTVSDDGRILTNEEAIEQFKRTKKHLGMFDTRENAESYAERLHTDQERQYARPTEDQAGFRTQAGKGPSAYSVAQRYLGQGERTHAKVLAEFFERSAGQKLDPAQTAWCMAFVNAAIGGSGAGGTGTLTARDALRIGTPTRDPQEGDIVVMDRGSDPNKGHVGFYVGRNPDGSVNVLGGNQGEDGQVSIQAFPAGRVLGFRTPPKAGTQVPGVDPNSVLRQEQEREAARSSEEADMVLGRSPSPRFAGLPPARRRALANNARVALRAVTQQELGDDLERIRRTGRGEVGQDGMTALDRARRVLTPNQLAKAEIAADEAQRTFQATAGLSDLTENEAAEHLNALAPSQQSPDESYRTSVRVQTKATKAWDKIADLRQKDPAQAVSGGVIRGSGARSQVTVGPNGELVVTPGGDDDIRNQPAPEVASAVELLRRRRPEVSLTQGEDGSVEVQTQQGQEVSGVAAWKAIIEARVAAQTRLGIPDWQRRVITRREGQALLDMPDDAGMNDREFTRRLKAAADRADKRYGPEYARQALEAALSFRRTGDNRRVDVDNLIAKLARNENVGRDDMRRVEALSDIDRIGRLWEGPIGGDISNSGFQREDRPAIMPTAGVIDRNVRRQAGEVQRQVTQKEPPPEIIEWLKRNPDKFDVIDRDWGPGTAARYLNPEPSSGR